LSLRRGAQKVVDCLTPTADDHAASSLPAEVTGPLTFFPLGENCEGFTRNNHQSKKGLNYENLIVHCIHTHLLRAFT
jgi:hypothetical protein